VINILELYDLDMPVCFTSTNSSDTQTATFHYDKLHAITAFYNPITCISHSVRKMWVFSYKTIPLIKLYSASEKQNDEVYLSALGKIML